MIEISLEKKIWKNELASLIEKSARKVLEPLGYKITKDSYYEWQYPPSSTELRKIEIGDMLKPNDLEDGLHPNSNGHAKMFERIKTEIANELSA